MKVYNISIRHGVKHKYVEIELDLEALEALKKRMRNRLKEIDLEKERINRALEFLH